MATPKAIEVLPSLLLKPIIIGPQGVVPASTNTVSQTTAHRRGTKFPPPNIHDERYLKPFEYGEYSIIFVTFRTIF